MGETQVLQLPFAGGLDELVSKEYLDASARQASILNGEFPKAGSINKRQGLEYLTTTLLPGGGLAAPTAGIRAVGWSRSSLSLLGSGGFYQSTGSGIIGTGALSKVGVVRRPIQTEGEGLLSPPVVCDLAYSGRTLRITISTPFYFVGSVADADTGDVILPPTDFGPTTGLTPHVVSAFALPNESGGPVAIIVYHEATSGGVHYVKYDPATNTFGAPVSLVAAGVRTVDAAPYEDDPSNGWLVAYDIPATNTFRLAHWTLAGLQTSVDWPVAAAHTIGLGIYVCGRFGQSVWTAWKSFDTIDYYWAQRRAGDSTLTTATAPFQFQALTSIDDVYRITGIAHLGTDKIFVSYRLRKKFDGSNWGTARSCWRVLSHSAGTISSLAFGQIAFGMIALTKPFVISGEVYQAFVYNLNYLIPIGAAEEYKSKQTTLYLCRFDGVSDSMSSLGTIKPNKCFPVATAAPRQVEISYQGRSFSPSEDYRIAFPSSVQRAATRVAVGINTINTTGGNPSWSVDFLFGSDSERDLYQTSELGSELSISSGVPFVSDGATTFEDGFFNYPEFTRPFLTGSGTTLPTGDYTFAVTYASTDTAGLVHRSAPYITPPVSVTLGSTYPVLDLIAPIGGYRDFFATEDDTGKVRAEIYMTRTNGSTLFFLGGLDVTNVFGILPDDPWDTGSQLEFSTFFSGLPVDGAPILYTTGGVLDHVNPPASSSQITHQKRKALVDETRRGVWLSKQFSPGIAPGFNEALYIDFPDGEDIVALGSLDSRLIAFKENSIWYIDGQGPSPNGQGASWTDPQQLPSDIGCKSWQSVVPTPNGLMFQGSDNGLYLLGRDLTVSFVGRNVIDSTNDCPNVVSAVLVPASSQVRFVCLYSAGTGHLVVVYDYLLNAWTTHRYDHLTDVPVAVCMSADSTPRYSILSADGEFWQERLPTDAARYLDEDADEETHFVPTVVTLPFVKLQVQGYHRARRVQFFGERLDDCGFQIQMAFNYDGTVRQTATWSASQLASLSVKGQVEAYVGAAYNKQMSVQVTFSDTAGTAMTTGEGMRFASAAIELQNLGSRYKLLGAGARR